MKPQMDLPNSEPAPDLEEKFYNRKFHRFIVYLIDFPIVKFYITHYYY